MSEQTSRALSELLGERVVSLTPVPGGDINLAFRAELELGARLFVKTCQGAPAEMYGCEAEGLAWLGEAAALRVPRVQAVSPDFLVLEWIEPRARAGDFDEQLGRGLARLHRMPAPGFGFSRDNFIGPLTQPNAARESWSAFYREQRLRPLIARASARGSLPGSLRLHFEELCERLDTLVGPAEPPSRLHGDLWSGNVHTDEQGAPVLIDPAVYGGQREIDLAMLQLFGAPSERFFAAYDETFPRAEGHAERLALYQLYPLLVHVCLFGSGYVGSLRSTLERALSVA